MPRRKLHPGGAKKLSLYLPDEVVDGLDGAAGRRQQSMSLLASIILGDWLRQRGELPLREREEAAV